MLNLETTQKPAEDGEKVEIPKLVLGGAILASINLIIGFCIALAPDLDVELEGAKQDPPGAYSFAKPSPFTHVADAKPRKARAAQKLTPVLYSEPAYSSYELNIPRWSIQSAIYVTDSERLQSQPQPKVLAPNGDAAPPRATVLN